MIKRDEAMGLLNKFQSEGTQLLCTGSIFGAEFKLVGKITSLSPTVVSVSSADGQSEITVRLDQPDIGFEYREPKDVVNPHEKDTLPATFKSAAGLGFLLAKNPQRYVVFFLETS